MIENSDIRAVTFITNKKNKFDLSEDYLKRLKDISPKEVIDEAYDYLINDIRNNNLTFQISLQEENYIKYLKEENILEYILYRYKFKEYPKKKISTKFPIYILIEPVSSCNLKCPMCFQSDKTFIDKKYMGKMSFDLFKKIVDEAQKKGTKAITFGSRGEPTIHPEICEFLKYLKGKFLDIKLITNATKLNEKLIRTIFETKVNLVTFSIDSEDEKIYEEIRKFGKFNQVLENVKNYNKIKKEYDNCNTITRISGVKVKAEQDEKKFESFWKEYADEVSIKKAFERWNTYNNEKHPTFTNPCRAIWERIYIWYDGKTNPCDADYKSFLSYGNVNEKSIEEIWNSEKINNLKDKHLNNKRSEITPCDRCGIY